MEASVEQAIAERRADLKHLYHIIREEAANFHPVAMYLQVTALTDASELARASKNWLAPRRPIGSVIVMPVRKNIWLYICQMMSSSNGLQPS